MLINELMSNLKSSMRPIDYETADTLAGSRVERGFWAVDRYIFDYAGGSKAAGWVAYDTDQDAEYFGVWCNPKTLQSLTYVEGDWILVTCGCASSYNEMVTRLLAEHDAGPQYVVVWPVDMQAAVYRDAAQLFAA